MNEDILIGLLCIAYVLYILLAIILTGLKAKPGSRLKWSFSALLVCGYYFLFLPFYFIAYDDTTDPPGVVMFFVQIGFLVLALSWGTVIIIGLGFLYVPLQCLINLILRLLRKGQLDYWFSGR